MGAAMLDLSDGAQAHVHSTTHVATTIFNVALQTNNIMLEALCEIERMKYAFSNTCSDNDFQHHNANEQYHAQSVVFD